MTYEIAADDVSIAGQPLPSTRVTDYEWDGAAVAALRAREYARLDEQNQIYLDYTGGGLYAESQLRKHGELLRRGVFGNPHSGNPTSRAATRLADAARRAVLAFLSASPDEYTVIFTANASGALKLVGESYAFTRGSRLLLTADNHNSVNGIREFARSRGADVTYLPLRTPDLRQDGKHCSRGTRSDRDKEAKPARLSGPVQLLGRPPSARLGDPGP